MVLPRRRTWPRWARAATSGWVVSPLLVFALLIGAFLGYGAWTRSRPTHYDRGGAFTIGALPHTGGGGTGPGSRPASKPGVHPSATPGPSTSTGSTSTSPRPGSTTGTFPTAGSLTSPAATRADSPATPRVGDYTLAVSGGEHVSFGPFAACRKTFPSRAVLGVRHAAGESASSYDFDLRLYPGSPGVHDERHIYRYGPSALFLDYEQATVTCAGIKQSSTIDYHPAQTRVLLPLRVGATWRSKGGDSKRTETAQSRVSSRTHLTVDGVSYPVYVIDTSVAMTGSESGTRTQRWWYSPALAMPLKWHEELSGSRSGAKYSENLTATVVSIP